MLVLTTPILIVVLSKKVPKFEEALDGKQTRRRKSKNFENFKQRWVFQMKSDCTKTNVTELVHLYLQVPEIVCPATGRGTSQPSGASQLRVSPSPAIKVSRTPFLCRLRLFLFLHVSVMRGQILQCQMPGDSSRHALSQMDSLTSFPLPSILFPHVCVTSFSLELNLCKLSYP